MLCHKPLRCLSSGRAQHGDTLAVVALHKEEAPFYQGSSCDVQPSSTPPPHPSPLTRSQEHPPHPHTVPAAEELVRAYRSEKPRQQTRPLSANGIRERAEESLNDGTKRLKAIEVR